LDAKTKCLSCKCTQDRWDALMTLVEEQEMLKTINNGGKQENGKVSKDSSKGVNRNATRSV
jgi:hypothetical protein